MDRTSRAPSAACPSAALMDSSIPTPWVVLIRKMAGALQANANFRTKKNGPTAKPILERLEGLTRKTPRCWTWIGTMDRNGYGSMVVGSRVDGSRRTKKAYRVWYEIIKGPIPGDMEIDHRCRNRACVNPSHLEVVTHRENMVRGATFAAANVAKTTCPKGHQYTEENTYRRPDAPHQRECLTCRKTKRKERYWSNKK